MAEEPFVERSGDSNIRKLKGTIGGQRRTTGPMDHTWQEAGFVPPGVQTGATWHGDTEQIAGRDRRSPRQGFRDASS